MLRENFFEIKRRELIKKYNLKLKEEQKIEEEEEEENEEEKQEPLEKFKEEIPQLEKNIFVKRNYKK
jgi:hypothetical protein